jgi:glycolate oxidase iron-sulfur subunit
MNMLPTSEIPVIGYGDKDRPNADVINTCVHCGLCLPSCPTYRMTGSELASPRGRIYLMKGVTEGRISMTDNTFMEQMGLCLNCRACEAVCPSGVMYGGILEASRDQLQHLKDGKHEFSSQPQAQSTPTPRTSFAEKTIRTMVFGKLFKNMALFRSFSWAIKAYQKTGVQSLARKIGILKLIGMQDAERMLPTISDRFVVPKGQIYKAQGTRKHTVALLSGCIMSTAFAQVHDATVRVLQKNGCDVILPEGQGCCGALHTHGGDLDGGRDLARANIEAFEKMGLDKVDAIIVNAAGCGSTLKEYGHLLHDDPAYSQRAVVLAKKIRDVHEFLASIELNRTDLKPLPIKVTYQEPCHMAHAQRITAQPRALLKAIPQLQLVEMFESSMCCGSAGIYNITQPEMAGELGARKIENALATHAQVIATGNPGCALQLAAELNKRGKNVQVKYVVELLDQSYGASKPEIQG